MPIVDIESLAFGGDGVAHLEDGRAVFVPMTCPGDRAEIEIVEEHPRFARARLTQLATESPDRVTPPCPYFGDCGGCQWQHVSYDAQLAAKRRAVVDALERIGGVRDADALVAAVTPSSAQLGYRNKIELVVDPHAERFTLGYHRASSTEVVAVQSCLLLPKRLQKAPRALAGALRYISGAEDLAIERIAIRAARHTKDVEIAIWTPPGPFPRAAAAKVIGQALPTTSLVRVLYKDQVRRRTVTKVEVLQGKGSWRERLRGLDYSLSAPSFFQTNTPAAENLVELVLEALEPDGSDHVADLYAGAGTFTLPLAEVAGSTVAIESSGPAVRDLRRNLEANLVHADVIGGDATRELPSLGHLDLAVVDPPRSGMEPPAVEALAAAGPRVIAYVSCDPATLARDVKSFAAVGYELTGATPVDLFPQTYHVETVARLARP